MSAPRRRLMMVKKSNLDPVTGRGIIDGYEVVDLKLPSHILWATCNVGASSESGYGNHYMYGKGSRTFNRSDSKYSGTENPLDSSVDTATQVMGSQWRMPTQNEMNELQRETNGTWTTINGVNGMKFASKTDSNRYLFIPAAGYKSGTNTYNQGTYGYMWSSTPSDSSYAIRCYVNNNNYKVEASMRTMGLSIRGVRTSL